MKSSETDVNTSVSELLFPWDVLHKLWKTSFGICRNVENYRIYVGFETMGVENFVENVKWK